MLQHWKRMVLSILLLSLLAGCAWIALSIVQWQQALQQHGYAFLPEWLVQSAPTFGIPVEADFATWLAAEQHQAQVQAYVAFLKTHDVDQVLDLPNLLSSARDWQKCQSSPFIVPPPEKWQNMINTLKLLRQLQQQQLLPAFSVTSSFRYPELNRCAGGSAKSKHLTNGALDLRFQDPASAAKTFAALCQFWQQQGAKQAMGLGFYPGGQIHIDTQGFRTWGQDYTAKSSPCHL